MMRRRHNLTARRPTWLTLSEVRRQAPADYDAAGGIRRLPHVHDRRLCAPCVSRRHRELNPRHSHRYAADLIATRIRLDGGDVWPAIVAFGVSYRHACRIRNGWRPDGRRAEAVPYRARGWRSGERAGWVEPELRLVWGDR